MKSAITKPSRKKPDIVVTEHYTDEQLRRAAYLYSQGFDNKEIAQMVGIGKNHTKLVRQHLEAAGLLIHICNVGLEEQLEYDGMFLNQDTLRELIITKTGIRPDFVPQNIRVIDTGVDFSNAKNDEDRERLWELSARLFGRKLAELPIIHELLRYVPKVEQESDRQNWKTLGLCYSRVVRSFIDALAERETHAKWSLKRGEGQEVIFVPLWPEPLAVPMQGSAFFSGERLSPTAMARDFANVINNTPYKPLSLHMMPAFDPQVTTEESDDYIAAKRLFRRLTAFDLIFTPPEERDNRVRSQWDLSNGDPGAPQKVPTSLQPLVRHLDIIMLGIGASEFCGNFWNGAFWEHGEIDRDALSKAVIGDVGGCFINNPNQSPEGKKLIEDLENRWNGLKKEHLFHCADRSRRENLPGVMAFVVGDRSEILLEAILQGLVNCVWMDRVCYNSLIRFLNELKPR